MSNRVYQDDQIRLITGCHRSGLPDYQRCEQNGIYPGNLYNCVSKLRKSGYTIPESEAKENALPNVQEVVKLDLVSEPEPVPIQLIKPKYNNRLGHIARVLTMTVQYALSNCHIQGRKNRLFSDTLDGATANALYLTIVEMAKAYDLNIYEFLKYLLAHHPAYPCQDDELA